MEHHMVTDYIKQILITENPVKQLLKDRGNVSYLDTVYDNVADSIAIFIVEDGMKPGDALKYVLGSEFGHEELDDQRIQNCIARLSMLRSIIDGDPEKELMK